MQHGVPSYKSIHTGREKGGYGQPFAQEALIPLIQKDAVPTYDDYVLWTFSSCKLNHNFRARNWEKYLVASHLAMMFE